MVTRQPPHVAVVGAGPAGLMAAEALAAGGATVTVYDAMPSPARKLLMAGRGGLNLTHSDPLETFLQRYPIAPPALLSAIRAFPPDRLIAWAHELGQPTFVGTSGRVFPTSLKASPLLRAWLQRLAALGVVIKPNHRWTGWAGGSRTLAFATPSGQVEAHHDATLLALGGASWPRLGSDAAWTTLLQSRGVPVAPLQASNCGVSISWSRHMQRHEGAPLKRIALTVGHQTVRGEAIVTRQGLEGGPVYALAPSLRSALADASSPILHVDLRPDVSIEDLAQRLALPRQKQSTATYLRKQVKLTPAAISLMNEACAGKLPTGPLDLATLIKAVGLPVHGFTDIARAISCAGGVPFSALTDDFMICALPGTFVAGEMLDWDAPTGGYLLQACFATGAAAACGLLTYLHAQELLSKQPNPAIRQPGT